MSGAGVAAAVAGAVVAGGISAATAPKAAKGQAAPDPKVTADEQIRINRDQSAYDAQMNRYSQTGPDGNVTWENVGSSENPQWIQHTNLSPANQALYDQQLANQNKLAGQAGQYSDKYYGLLNSTARPVNYDTFNKVAQTQLDRMTPGLDHRTNMLTTSLANQGLAPGGEAYTNAMRDDSMARNDANLAAINSAMNAQVQQEGMANTNEAQNNDNQRQAINNMGSMLQGSGSVGMPSYSGGTTVGVGLTPDMESLYQNQYTANNNNQIASNNAKTASKNQLGSAGGQLGSVVNKGLSNSSAFQGLFK